MYQLYAAVRQPQETLDPDIIAYNGERAPELHFGYAIEISAAIEYAKQNNAVVDSGTGVPVDWDDPPEWAMVERLCVGHVVWFLSQQCKFTFLYASVMGPEGPKHFISLYNNAKRWDLGAAREGRLLRKIREAFNIAQDESPRWWWDTEVCGTQYVIIHMLLSAYPP